MRFFLEIAYNGTSYHGWQVQPNADTIQARMNYVLTNLFQEEINCLGCGRTDTGVHASQFFLHFDCSKEPDDNFIFRINRFLPREIAVKQLIPVKEDAHARFDATYRAYNYNIHFQKNPYAHNLSFYYQYPHHLDFKVMQTAFNFLQEVEDFSSFQKKSETATSICDIYKTALIFNEDKTGLQVHVAANRFLRGMVRLIVGSLFIVGEGKITLESYKQHVLNRATLPHIRSVPACGLYLSEVKYNYIK